MITDPRVFEGRYLPNSLPYRDAELSQLARSLEPVCRGEPANDVLISGPSGVGKTVLARYTLDKIEELEAMPHTYVRCLGNTGGDILRAVLQDPPDVDPVGLANRIEDALKFVLTVVVNHTPTSGPPHMKRRSSSGPTHLLLADCSQQDVPAGI